MGIIIESDPIISIVGFINFLNPRAIFKGMMLIVIVAGFEPFLAGLGTEGFLMILNFPGLNFLILR